MKIVQSFIAKPIIRSVVVLLSMKPILVNKKKNTVEVPYPYKNAEDILKHCSDNGLMLSTVMLENEVALHGKEAVSAHLENVWKTMQACIEHGIHTEGILPGPLRVPRRAASLYRMLQANTNLSNDPMRVDRLG